MQTLCIEEALSLLPMIYTCFYTLQMGHPFSLSQQTTRQQLQSSLRPIPVRSQQVAFLVAKLECEPNSLAFLSSLASLLPSLFLCFLLSFLPFFPSLLPSVFCSFLPSFLACLNETNLDESAQSLPMRVTTRLR